MPDELLLGAAAKGRLADPALLSKQVDRMLDDPKARALAENFLEQWLCLR